jgi:hypothetical protein
MRITNIDITRKEQCPENLEYIIIIIIIIITSTTTTTTAIWLSPGGSSPTLVLTKIKLAQNNKITKNNKKLKTTK